MSIVNKIIVSSDEQQGATSQNLRLYDNKEWADNKFRDKNVGMRDRLKNSSKDRKTTEMCLRPNM